MAGRKKRVIVSVAGWCLLPFVALGAVAHVLCAPVYLAWCGVGVGWHAADKLFGKLSDWLES